MKDKADPKLDEQNGASDVMYLTLYTLSLSFYN